MIRAFDQIFKAFSSRRQAAADETAQVRLAVAVDLGADRELARAVRAALLPRTATAKLYVAGYGPRGGMPAVNGLSDAAVVLAGPSAVSAAALWRAYGAAGVPCCVLAGPAAARAAAEAGVRGGNVLACDAAGVAEGLGSWLVGALPERASALGAGFACCRRARALLAAREAARDVSEILARRQAFAAPGHVPCHEFFTTGADVEEFRSFGSRVFRHPIGDVAHIDL